LSDVAVGCTNPVLGPGMFHKRDPSSSSDDVIIVGCRATNERWRLTCVSGVWTGDVIGNCSAGALPVFFIRIRQAAARKCFVHYAYCHVKSKAQNCKYIDLLIPTNKFQHNILFGSTILI